MAIDRVLRQRVADAMDAFLKGTIDSHSLDDAVFSKKTDDVLCAEIRRQVWLFYDDTRKYMNEGNEKLPPFSEAILKRWILILRSELQWSDLAESSSSSSYFGRFGRFWRTFMSQRLTPRPKFRFNPYWPFSSVVQWDSFTDGMRRGAI